MGTYISPYNPSLPEEPIRYMTPYEIGDYLNLLFENVCLNRQLSLALPVRQASLFLDFTGETWPSGGQALYIGPKANDNSVTKVISKYVFCNGTGTSNLATVKASSFEGPLSGNANTATSATYDSRGNNIYNYYASKSELQALAEQSIDITSISGFSRLASTGSFNDLLDFPDSNFIHTNGDTGTGHYYFKGPDDAKTYIYGNLIQGLDASNQINTLWLNPSGGSIKLGNAQSNIAIQGSLSTAGSATITGNLSASGNVSVTGNLTAARVYNAYYNDLAEFFLKGEESEKGDIIALDMNSEKEVYIKAVKGNPCIIGVHSDEYAMIMGGDLGFQDPNDLLDKYIPVALAGRVYVKVKGIVHKGDLIGPSLIPGIGEVTLDDSVGIALQDKLTMDLGIVRILVRRK